MHLSDGDIRAYHDLALGENAQAEAKAHLEACTACRQRAETLLTAPVK